MLERANQKLFLSFLTLSALFIAGCAAFFSVRGISLLFAGSMFSVAIMASSLEIGKLMAASFVYRQWNKMKFVMKFYLCVAVVMLIGITSLGVYGFLSDAFDKTMTKVALYETNIVQVEKQINTYQKEIDKIESAADVVDQKATDSIAQYQKIYDDYVNDQRARQQSLRDQIKQMDQAIADIESQPGGLFSNKSSKLKKLREDQAASREEINSALQEIDKSIDSEYKKFLTKVENLRETTEKVPDNVEDVNSIYTKIRDKEQEILTLREEIRNTDIGSFRFIARSFDMELEDVVKWFILVICLVFDPLAVVLVVGINMMIADRLPVITNKKKELKTNTTTTTTTNESYDAPDNVYHVKWYPGSNDAELKSSPVTTTVKVSTTTTMASTVTLKTIATTTLCQKPTSEPVQTIVSTEPLTTTTTTTSSVSHDKALRVVNYISPKNIKYGVDSNDTDV